MKRSTVEQAAQTRHLLLTKLREHQTPISLQELGLDLGGDNVLSQRTLKEAAWQLVEEGKVRFNSTWDLEIV